MNKIIRIAFACSPLFLLSSIFAQYVLLNKPDLHANPNGGFSLSSHTKTYTIAVNARQFAISDGVVNALFLIKKASEGTYDCVVVLDSNLADEKVCKYLDANGDGAEFDSSDLIRRVKALMDSPAGSVPGKYYIIARLSVLTRDDVDFDNFLVNEFLSSKNIAFVKSILPALCANSSSIAAQIIKQKQLDEDVFSSILKFLPYDSSSRVIFLNALSSGNDHLIYEALNKLRGVADKSIVPAARDAVLHGSPRSQWAAFMCLSTALKLPIDTPSLAAYEKTPEVYFKKLAQKLMK